MQEVVAFAEDDFWDDTTPPSRAGSRQRDKPPRPSSARDIVVRRFCSPGAGAAGGEVFDDGDEEREVVRCEALHVSVSLLPYTTTTTTIFSWYVEIP